MTSPLTHDERRCCDCSKPYPGDVGYSLAPGWVALNVTGRVRCPDCADQLDRTSLRRIASERLEADSTGSTGFFDAGQRRNADPDPVRPFASGGGGDYAGAGASGAWQSASRSSESCSSSSSSASSSTSSSDTASGSSCSDSSSSSSGGSDS